MFELDYMWQSCELLDTWIVGPCMLLLSWTTKTLVPVFLYSNNLIKVNCLSCFKWSSQWTINKPVWSSLTNRFSYKYLHLLSPLPPYQILTFEGTSCKTFWNTYTAVISFNFLFFISFYISRYLELYSK